MEISKSAVGAFAIACLAAGAGASYLVTRSADPAPLAAAEPSEPLVSPDPDGLPGVEQSEALVANPEPADEPAVAPSRPAAPRAETPAPRPRPRPAAERRTAVVPEVITPEPQPVIPASIQLPEVSQAAPEQVVAPAGPIYEELVVAADSVIGLQMDSSVTSERARVEDQVVAHVTRDVRVGGRVAIPAGSKAQGEVTLVERGGRLRDRARLGVRFTSIVLADGTRVPIDTETVYREGDGPGNESAAKIGGGAIGGAIIGGILGGAKGAIIGGSAGAGAGTAAVLAGGRNPATLSSGSPVTVRLQEPAIVTVEGD